MNKWIGNVVGQKFGYLEVIEEFHEPKKGKYAGSGRNTLKLKCKCFCSNIFKCLKSNVLSGKTKRCSKCNNSHDLLGIKIGNLQIICRDLYRHGSYFQCLCDCGKEYSAKSHYLRNGKHPLSCEKCRYPKKYSPLPIRTEEEMKELLIKRAQNKHLASRKNVLGKKFNNLKVTKFSHWEPRKSNPNYKHSFYECKCKCGKIIHVRTDRLKITKSCGCISNRPRGEENPNSILTNKEAKSIREFIKSKMYTQRDLSKMFKVNESIISSIKMNKRYVETRVEPTILKQRSPKQCWEEIHFLQ